MMMKARYYFTLGAISSIAAIYIWGMGEYLVWHYFSPSTPVVSFPGDKAFDVLLGQYRREFDYATRGLKEYGIDYSKDVQHVGSVGGRFVFSTQHAQRGEEVMFFIFFEPNSCNLVWRDMPIRCKAPSDRTVVPSTTESK